MSEPPLAVRGDALQHALDIITGGRIPGMSVHISGSEGDLAVSSGCMARGREPRMSQSARYPIACMIKPVISYLALRAHSRGLLDIDAGIDEYLPEVRSTKHRNPVTLRHLLSHTGGFRDPGEAQARWRMSWEQLVDYFRDREQVFVPGTVWSYTHSGHALLAKAVERVEGREALEFARECAFDPLGIEVAPYNEDCVSPHRYSTNTGSLAPFRLPPERGMLRYSLSDMHLTPAEMARLGRFLYSPNPGDAASGEALALLQRQSVTIGGMAYTDRAEVIPETFGLGAGKVRGLFAQNGSFIGTTSAIRYDASSNTCVVVSMNCYDAYVRDQMGLKLATALTGVAPRPPPVCVLPFDIPELSGCYQGLMMGMGMGVIGDDGGCRVVGPAGEIEYKLTKSSEGLLSYTAAPGAPPIGFSKDPETGLPVMHVSVSAFKHTAR